MNPAKLDIDFMVFSLSDGNLSRAKIIESEAIAKCLSWHYMNRVKELNKMIIDVAEIEKIKEC